MEPLRGPAGGALVTSVWVLNGIGQGEETVEELDEDRVHFILLEQGFSILIFHLWTFTIDEDKGTKTAIDAPVNDDLTRRGLEPAYGPGYTARITIPKATIVRALPFVRIVYMHPNFDQKRRWGTMSDEGSEEAGEAMKARPVRTAPPKGEFLPLESVSLNRVKHRETKQRFPIIRVLKTSSLTQETRPGVKASPFLLRIPEVPLMGLFGR